MRSVHTEGSARAHRARVSDACVALSSTDAPGNSNCIGLSTIHLPAPLGSTGVTPHRSSYECSDSSAFVLERVAAPPSLGECRGLPPSRTPSSSHSASNHRTTPGHRFSLRLAGTCLDRSSDMRRSRQSYVSAISVTGYSRLRPSLAGSPGCRAESSSSTCGLAVRLPLLSTPPRGDAVTVGFQCKTPFGSGLTPLWRGTLEGVRAQAARLRSQPCPILLRCQGMPQTRRRLGDSNRIAFHPDERF